MPTGPHFRLRSRLHQNTLRISGKPVTAALIGDTYDFTPTVVGGKTPRRFVLTGTPPTGTTFNASTGRITGVLTAAGSFPGLKIQVIDNGNHTAQTSLWTVQVNTPASDFVLSGAPASVAAQVGTAVPTFTITPSGNTGAVTFSYDTVYSAPVGMTIGGSSGIGSGTPSVDSDGDYLVRVKGVDSIGSIAYTAVFPVTVRMAAPAFAVVAPTNETQYYVPRPANAIYDANGQTFIERPSTNPDPDGVEQYVGPGAKTRISYPIRSHSLNATWRGGRVAGEVSPTGNRHLWSTEINPVTHVKSYTNSAAITMDYSESGVVSLSQHVKRVRIDRCWDGIRFAAGTPNADTQGLCSNTIDQAWITNAHDDAIENDKCQTLAITDSLFDGVYVGISCDPGAGSTTPDHQFTDMITIDGWLCRLQLFPDSSVTEGEESIAFFKWGGKSPRITISNSILCFQAARSERVQRWTGSWSRLIDGGGNKLLFTGGDQMPGAGQIGTPPPGFAKLTNLDNAQGVWDAAASAWRTSHKHIFRMGFDTE